MTQDEVLALINAGRENFFKLSPHARHRWFQRCKGPSDQKLRQFLIQCLWQADKFKEVLDLLPPLSTADLATDVRLHTQTLFRQCLAGTSHVKKLIPYAVSYGNFLNESEASALTRLLEQLVTVRADAALSRYHAVVVQVVRKAKESPLAKFDPRYAISPELARFLPTLREQIRHALETAHSPYSIYYEPGGHFLLLAEGEYFAETRGRDRKSLSEPLNFRLDAWDAVHAGGNLGPILYSYQGLLAKSLQMQSLLAELIEKTTVQTLKPKARLRLAEDLHQLCLSLNQSKSKLDQSLATTVKRIKMEAEWKPK